MLVVQAMLFTWVVAQSGRTLPGQSPDRFAETVALDLRNALEREPQLDVARYIRDEYAEHTHPFFVMLADGRVVTSGSRSFPEPLIRLARLRLQRVERPEAERPGRRERDAAGFTRPTPVVVGDRLAAVVVVPTRAPFGFLLARFAPTLTLVAAGSRSRRRRDRGRRHRLQRDGRRPQPPRRCPGGVRPRAASAARRRLPRADDAGDGDARVSRNADHARDRARRADAGALSDDHQRRIRAGRTEHRRSALYG